MSEPSDHPHDDETMEYIENHVYRCLICGKTETFSPFYDNPGEECPYGWGPY